MAEHRFGGAWTEAKLATLRKYLEAYRRIFTRNERARYLRSAYIDAFAGTAYRLDSENEPAQGDQETVDEVQEFRTGSTLQALELEEPFDEYIFIEKNPAHAEDLRDLARAYSHLGRAIQVQEGDANTALQRICAQRDWKRNRAVVFLDPYGMQVTWETIEAIASTKAIDMWLLFPIGQAVNRLLTRRRRPPKGFAHRLTVIFGTDEWLQAFYRVDPQQGLFDDEVRYAKHADWDAIAEFFLERLRTVFHAVAGEYLLLRNSRNVPIYMLCFAVANPRAEAAALHIARSLLKQP